jgi:hypothetical protein
VSNEIVNLPGNDVNPIDNVAERFSKRVDEQFRKFKTLGTHLSDTELREQAELATYREFRHQSSDN